MPIPVIRGVIDRRILVNYRVDPDVLARILPQPFRPKLVNGMGMAGVCLIRLKHIRPRFDFLLPGRGVPVLRAGVGRLLGDPASRRVRWPGTAELPLAGSAARRREGGVELL